MSLLWKDRVTTAVLKPLIFSKKPSPTLRAFPKKSDLKSRDEVLHTKGIPLSMSWKRSGARDRSKQKSDHKTRVLAGSMTVEAAVIVPLFLFFFMNLMSVMEMMRLHCNLELALWKNGKTMTVVGHALGESEEESEWHRIGKTLLTDYALYQGIVNELGEDYLDNSPMTYGNKGLNFLESSYMEDDCIDVKLTYRVSPEFSVPGFPSVRLANRYYARAWTGYCVEGEGQDASGYVYVTVYGEVFHEKLDCSALKRTIQEVELSTLGSRRNDTGEQYSLCEQCGEGDSQDTVVYVTPIGNRYHLTLSCPSLKRVITVQSREEAQKDYRACSFCAAESGG